MRRAQTSPLSRVVLAVTFGAAFLGWIDRPPSLVSGVSSAADETSLHEARRTAWQPSPMPSSSGMTIEIEVDAESGPRPETPSLVLATPLPLPGNLSAADTAMPEMTRPVVSPGVPAVPAISLGLPGTESTPAGQPGTVFPFKRALNHDRLEALFDGKLPERRGEWRHITFFSRSLERDETYLAWVPPSYDDPENSARNYATLYLLHGAGGNDHFGPEEWLGYALTEDLDRLHALRLIEPMIVILPNGQQDYWINHAGGGPMWADFVAVDLVRHVDTTFRTAAIPSKRAIGGLSMGAHGALQLAFNHPNVFNVVGAHSPTIRPFEESPEFFGDQEWFDRFDPLALVRSTDSARRVITWIDVGENDPWRASTEELVEALREKRAPFTYRVLEGEHEGWYWKGYLPEYLRFYSAALNPGSTSTVADPSLAET